MNNVHFSSATDEWATPQDVYKSLDKEFHFTFDPCPLRGGCDYYKKQDGFIAIQNGLLIPWGKSNFVNPPYSAIKHWCRKAYEEWQLGKTIVMLIPSRTDTRYWHDYIMKSNEIRFIKGRLKFGNAKNSAPFPSAIVVFHGGYSAIEK